MNRTTKLLFLLALVTLFSCENPIKQEQYWFNVGFDSTYYMYFTQPGFPEVPAEVRARNSVNSLKNKARNSKELARYKDALFAGVKIIKDAFDETGLSKCGACLVFINSIGTEVGEWVYPDFSRVPEEYTWEYYRTTIPRVYGLGYLYSYEDAKSVHADSKKFLNYLKENKETLRKAGWQSYLRERKFKEY